MAKTKRERAAESAEAVERLRGWLKPGDRLYFVCTYHSSRGYSTHGYEILLACAPDPNASEGFRDRPWIANLTYNVGIATGTWRELAREIRISGCGFDKRHHVCAELSRLLGGEYDTPEGRIRPD